MASRIVQYFADKLRTVKEYPITLTKAVYDENGKRLDDIITEFDSDLTNMIKTKTELITSDRIITDTGMGGYFTSIDIPMGSQIISAYTSWGKNSGYNSVNSLSRHDNNTTVMIGLSSNKSCNVTVVYK